MAKDLKVGERVAVYGTCLDQYKKQDYLRGDKSTVIDSPFSPGEYNVKRDVDGWIYTVHPKQCRRLRPKKKRVAREVWIPESSLKILAKDVHPYTNQISFRKICHDDVRFREVLEGEK